MAEPKKVPYLSVDLIDYIDKLMPERSPDPNDSEREVWMKAGERRLVRKLIAFKRFINQGTITPEGGIIA